MISKYFTWRYYVSSFERMRGKYSLLPLNKCKYDKSERLRYDILDIDWWGLNLRPKFGRFRVWGFEPRAVTNRHHVAGEISVKSRQPGRFRDRRAVADLEEFWVVVVDLLELELDAEIVGRLKDPGGCVVACLVGSLAIERRDDDGRVSVEEEVSWKIQNVNVFVKISEHVITNSVTALNFSDLGARVSVQVLNSLISRIKVGYS